MRVEMLTQISGTRDGQEWPHPGDTIDVPDHEAADLIRAGYAKEAADAPTPDPVPAPVADEDRDEPAPAEDGDAAEPTEPVAPVKPARAPRKSTRKG